jgi:hypothetical protein
MAQTKNDSQILGLIFIGAFYAYLAQIANKPQKRGRPKPSPV